MPIRRAWRSQELETISSYWRGEFFPEVIASAATPAVATGANGANGCERSTS